MTLDENDFLTFQLYNASKSPRIRRGRIKSWIITTVMFLCFACLFYQSNQALLTSYFLTLSGLSLVFFPYYTRWRYRKHYLNHIRETDSVKSVN